MAETLMIAGLVTGFFAIGLWGGRLGTRGWIGPPVLLIVGLPVAFWAVVAAVSSDARGESGPVLMLGLLITIVVGVVGALIAALPAMLRSRGPV